jgi:hypothetical protein
MSTFGPWVSKTGEVSPWPRLPGAAETGLPGEPGRRPWAVSTETLIPEPSRYKVMVAE